MATSTAKLKLTFENDSGKEVSMTFNHSKDAETITEENIQALMTGITTNYRMFTSKPETAVSGAVVTTTEDVIYEA